MKGFRCLAFILAVVLMLCSLVSCGKVVKTKEISDKLTQTKVILSELPSDRAEYSEFFGFSDPMFYTPGLLQGFIPQGLCYSPENELVIISGYYEDDTLPSRLAVVDDTTGELMKSVGLALHDGQAFFGHVGGAACSENTLYITCDSTAYTLSLSVLKNAADGDTVRFEGSFALNTKGSFASFEDGVLWTGDFVEDNSEARESAAHITTLPSGETLYAWCEGYKLLSGKPDEGRKNTAETGYIPDCLLAIPLEVQGMTQLPDGRFVFCTSYGRKENSKLIVCEDVFLKDALGTRTVDGEGVPFYCFSEDSCQKVYIAPPMAEGIDVANDKEYLLFESGAALYRSSGGKYPTDYVLGLDIP